MKKKSERISNFSQPKDVDRHPKLNTGPASTHSHGGYCWRLIPLEDN